MLADDIAFDAAVLLGPISIPFLGRLGPWNVELDSAEAVIGTKVPLHRSGKADEIARAVLFLANGTPSAGGVGSSGTRSDPS